MKWLKDALGKNWVPYTVATCSAVLLYFALNNIGLLFQGLSALYSFAVPVVVAVIIAYVLNPMVTFMHHTFFGRMQSEKWGRNLGVLTTVLLVVLSISLLLLALVPQIIASIITFAENFDSYTKSLQKLVFALLNRGNQESAVYQVVDTLWEQIIEKISKLLSENMGKIIGTSFSIGKGFFSGIIGCILAIYFLIDAPNLVAYIYKIFRMLMPERKYKDLLGFFRRCNHILLRFILCDLLEGIFVGVMNFIFMTILGMDYAILISVVVAVTNLAPTFGPIVGGVIGAFILVLVNPWHALWFLVFTVILQTIDGYVIKPKLFGDTLGVSSVWILIVLILGGRMFGVAGILLAIPFAAICEYVFIDIIWKELEGWKEPKEEL